MWERDLCTSGTEPSWEDVWENLNSASKNLAHQLIHFKLIHRAYATPLKCFQMKLLPSPNCTHCPDQVLGTTMHMFWECRPIRRFWNEIFSVISLLLDIDLQPNPCLCLLNDDSHLSLTHAQLRLLLAGLTAAKKTILRLWFYPTLPLKQYWLTSYQYIASLECTTARLNNAQPKTIQAWSDISLSIQELLKSQHPGLGV